MTHEIKLTKSQFEFFNAKEKIVAISSGLG